MKDQLVSIVIPALNEEKYIGNLLGSIGKQTYSPIEVIVSDAGSDDRTREIAKAHGAKVVKGGHIAYGRNVGAKTSKGEVIVFVDSDVTFDPNFIENCYKHFTATKADVAACLFDTTGIPWNIRLFYWIWNIGKRLRDRTRYPDGEGQCMWVRREAFEDVHGFDEEIRVGEDVDFLYRVVAKGYKYRLLPYGFKPSDRRYKKVGALRVILGSFVSGIGLILGFKKGTKAFEKVYGGFGKN